MRVVLDTNVLLSGLMTPTGVPGRIVAAWIDAEFELVISLDQVSEVARVLAYPKIRDRLCWDQERIESFIKQLHVRAEVIDLGSTAAEVPRDPKDSPVLAPLMAACGAAVPQLSGRGLGHSGGTLDKLEAIAGWRASLSNAEILSQLADVGAVICAAGAGLAPADRRIYALRDVTGTVPSIPLIASSIMSKKIAEGTSALVLDVKVGSGAFMKTHTVARQLAEAMVNLGESHGVRTAALLTGMDTVLGRTAGNALEVRESVETLAGGGPEDLVEVTLALAREMVELAGLAADPAEVLTSGAAMDVWRAMIAGQGGDPDAELPWASIVETVNAPAGGVLGRLDALAVGIAAWRLGAGRARKEDPVSPTAGVVCRAAEGEPIRAGEPLLELHTDDESLLPGALAALEGGFDIVAEAGPRRPLVLDRVTAGGRA